MIGLGFPEMLVLVLMSGGMSSTDLVAMVPPAHYFQSRQVQVSIDRMIDIAITEPATPKAQVMQLTALRYLADEAENLKKANNYATNRDAIEQIAQGKKANDPQGFAKEYAQRVLMKLDGKKAEPVKTRPIREDALNWFPEDVKIAFAIDMRQPSLAANDPLKELLKLVPDGAKKEMYDQVEKIGNIRVERVAFGFVEGDKRGDQKIYMRLTGKANHAWLVDAIKSIPGERFESRKVKDGDGTPITVLQQQNSEPAIGVVGDTDLLVVGYDRPGGKYDDLVAQVLDIRAKKKANATTGPLKDRLAKIPDKAIAFAVGDIPNDMKQTLGFMLNGAPIPSKLSAFVERMPNGLDLQLETTMANAEDADKLVQKVGMLRKQGVEELKKAMQMPLPPGTPPIPFQGMINVLESLQVQSKGESVQTRAFVPDGLIQQLGSASMMMFGARGEFKKE
ncbi:MAG: hypothetical protein EXR98_14965 [Gemmataceae bacterium]|nr:hypothetical protein [Gemmataceae bacterium]